MRAAARSKGSLKFGIIGPKKTGVNLWARLLCCLSDLYAAKRGRQWRTKTSWMKGIDHATHPARLKPEWVASI